MMSFSIEHKEFSYFWAKLSVGNDLEQCRKWYGSTTYLDFEAPQKPLQING